MKYASHNGPVQFAISRTHCMEILLISGGVWRVCRCKLSKTGTRWLFDGTYAPQQFAREEREAAHLFAKSEAERQRRDVQEVER